ncbi:glucose-methanol-choline oxidoreductase [Sphingomonas sp. Leaf357]|uniref:GMC family oxidoreductase n=1 Tax=Sphingomonas sp. Leaf357 TaxID=1736350 RepID=UPI0006FCDC91|nr:GMC family oxidoreductase N-terminal domain-containing protein [Sphingomonas sp. Leaf357]KQS03169.1 glucose-methanol-choline oxidoreductase [Sphingomonas sp. Leaf357]
MEEADIVVVGGGSGGSAAAGRLSENGRHSVVLLEAGGANTGYRTRIPGFIAMQTPKTNWQFETVPQAGLNGRRGYQPRGRGLGGSSAINAMLYLRGNRWDYDNWAAMGCPGWSYDEVLPWFKHAERNNHGADAFHGRSGPLHVSHQTSPHAGSIEFVESARHLQIPVNEDFNGARQDGAGVFQVTQHNGERWSAGRAYLGQARANLDIRMDVIAERVLFEDGRACGVAYRQGGETHVVKAKRAVVLAGGVFGTPQLLMLSGIGPGAHLRDHGLDVRIDRPAVGANLQDHVDYVGAFETGGHFFLGQSLKGRLHMIGAIVEWFRRRTGTMTSVFAESGAFLTIAPDAPAPDVQLHFVPIVLEDHGRTKVKAHGFSVHVCVLRPESHGTVRLASTDARTAPLIDPAFLTDARDMDLMKQGVRAMYRIVATPPLSGHAPRDRYPVDLDDDAALERLIRARADTIYHPVGTARMGSDDVAVCDPRLRVRGVAGLYVADAAIMPKLVSGNTNAPSIMIGERCADFVAADLG